MALGSLLRIFAQKLSRLGVQLGLVCMAYLGIQLQGKSTYFGCCELSAWWQWFRGEALYHSDGTLPYMVKSLCLLSRR